MIRDISLPVRKKLAQGNQASYEIGPLLDYLSLPLANAIRRVSLSSLSGAAITTVRIEGVQHEFQDIEHVKEDVPDIVQNLKKVRLRSFSNRAVTVYLDVRGERVVTAGDIKVPGIIEIVNPEAYIATLDNEHAYLSMEMTVNVGHGFVSAETQAEVGKQYPIGLILIDALYAPVTHAGFRIEQGIDAINASKDDFAVITLEITTDGTISPDEALRQSADILARQFTVLASDKYERSSPERASHWSDVLIPEGIYAMPLADLGLSNRAQGILHRSGYRNVGMLLEMDEKELLAIHNMGEKTLKNICDCFKRHGLLPKEEV